MQKVLCGNALCLHPRSEHKATFDTGTTDYHYGKCTVFECPCHSYVPEASELEILDDAQGDRAGETAASETNQNHARCICGGDSKNHVRLSDECLTQCEANWRELEALRKKLANLNQPEPVNASAL